MNKYGLLGLKLGHSYSKIIHEYLFKKNNIDASYDLIEIEEADLKCYVDYLRNGIYKGYNVTIPYKEKIMPYLDELTDSAKKIKAVNTVYVENGKVIGDNTDYYGFIKELEYFNIDLNDKLGYVLGTGGASKAICYSLDLLNAKYKLVSRDINKGMTYDMLDSISSYDFIINTTPLGMWPNVDSSALNEAQAKKANCIVDLIFNPRVTKLMSYNDNSYNGLLMLIFQAIRAEEKWNNNPKYDLEELIKILE